MLFLNKQLEPFVFIVFIQPVLQLRSISNTYLLSEGRVSSRHRQAGWSDGQEVQRRPRFVSAVCERVMPHQSTGTTQHDALMGEQQEATRDEMDLNNNRTYLKTTTVK